MKTLSLILCCCTLSILGAQAQNIRENIPVKAFNQIDATYAFDIQVTKGSSKTLVLNCPERVRKYLEIKVENKTLKLSADLPKRFQLEEDENISILIEMEEIKKLDLSGACTFSATGNFQTQEFQLSLSGAAEIENELYISGEHLDYSLSGASEASITGDFQTIRGHVSGASEFSIHGNSQNTEISCSGASEFKYIGQISESTSVNCSGASEVKLEGSTSDISIECSGASEVDAREMIAQNGIATASGASSIKIYGDEKLVLKTSGSSSIRYYGKAKEILQPNNSIQRGK